MTPAPQLTLSLPGDPRFAEISPCGLYRYTLGHVWSASRGVAVFGLCNPSTATHEQDDQTTRVLGGFTREWRLGGWIVVNACAYRATKPADLDAFARGGGNARGPDNDWWIRWAFERPETKLVVLGWGGALPNGLRVHGEALATAARECGREPMCLGKTRAGQPRHPLMMSYGTRLEAYGVAA